MKTKPATNSERQRRHRSAGARQISTPISDEAAQALAAIQALVKLTIRAAIESALIYTAAASENSPAPSAHAITSA